MSRAKPEPLTVLLETAIREVLNNPDADLDAKIQAINAGTRLATARYKISGDTEEGSFFKKKGRSK